MKSSKFKIILAGALAICALAFTAPVKAQTNPSTNSSPAMANFFSTAETWLTSHDTNNTTLSSDHGHLWTAPVFDNNVTIYDAAGFQYNLTRPSTNTVITAEAIVGNAGIAGTTYNIEGGPGFSYIIYDTELGAHIGGGDNFLTHDPYGYFAVDALKMMTENTFIGTRVEWQLAKKTTAAPLVYVQAGITF